MKIHQWCHFRNFLAHSIGININQITYNHNAELYSADDKERLIAYMRKLNTAVAKVVDIVGNQ